MTKRIYTANPDERVELSFSGDILQVELWLGTDTKPVGSIRLRGKEANEIINHLRKTAQL